MFSLSVALLAQVAAGQSPEIEPPPSEQTTVITANSTQMLLLAVRALASQQDALAIKILETLLNDPEVKVRNEARFRLAMLASRDRRWNEAGEYLRAILDEEPGAQRARLELARVQAELGELDASRRTLREAQAGGLPPDVARLVERFSAALRERKPFGVNVQIAIAPDSNINRATRSGTLGTILGDFELDDDARQSSGIGITMSSEAYYRKPLSAKTSLLARAGFTGNFYRADQFNDIAAIGAIGPEFPLIGGRANLLIGGQRRWFGGERYNDALDANLQWQRALGRRSQLRTGMSYSRTYYRFNELQDSDTLAGFASYERALSQRAGASLTIAGTRQIAADPAYSISSGQVSATGWREFGRTTLFASATYQHLEADRRLAIYPSRRKEDFLRLSLGATLRTLSWKGWAPQVKLIWENNSSPIEIYRYDRWRGEFGIARAF
ncbi:surface lipoprotein assembly modifier [Altererythrobacter sp. Z27]|uniref:surface lipoprotein assembly modifier n=1 Tax=Altererythrobacter sp. Z27 TaxID=3461147 RepID=UPI0040446F8A